MYKKNYITPQSEVLRVVTKSGICDVPFHPNDPVAGTSAWGTGETSPGEAPRKVI